jgi:hypothetical protein
MSSVHAAGIAVAPCRDYKFALEALDRPVISADEAAALVERHWGLRVLSVKELGSYEDRNYLVEGKQHFNVSNLQCDLILCMCS